MERALDSIRLIAAPAAPYAVRLARDRDEVKRAQALRFEVFNLELHEGLAESYANGLDEDPFDTICDHLVVEDLFNGRIVGTYRLQTGARAQTGRGYYSEQEFDFRPYAGLRHEMVELGRACVDRHHRNLVVLGLLWKGIADYARERKARYLVGCSSLTSQDPGVGASAFADLCRRHLAPPELRTIPRPAFECPLDQLAPEPPSIPKLLRAYLTIGAGICGPPALDRQFKTIDFLTLLDLERLPAGVRSRFLG